MRGILAPKPGEVSGVSLGKPWSNRSFPGGLAPEPVEPPSSWRLKPLQQPDIRPGAGQRGKETLAGEQAESADGLIRDRDRSEVRVQEAGVAGCGFDLDH